MASSKSSSSMALFLWVNLLCFALVSACGSTCPNPPKSKHKPKPTPTPSPAEKVSCPRDALKLGVCANLLGRLLGVVVGTPPTIPCCSLIQGVTDLEAAVCLCTAIITNVLGSNLDAPLSLSLLLNVCTKQVPPGFRCA